MENDAHIYLSEEEVNKFKEQREKIVGRKLLLRTKNGLIPRPLLLKWVTPHMGRKFLSSKYGFTESDEENDSQEIMEMEVSYHTLKGDITEETIQLHLEHYKAKHMKEEAELTEMLRKEDALKKKDAYLKSLSLAPLPRKLLSTAQKRKLDQDLEMAHKKIHTAYKMRQHGIRFILSPDDPQYPDIRREASKLWMITPVWRIYSFHFTQSSLSPDCHKLFTEFVRDEASRWMESVPVPDTTKMEPRVWTRRVKKFSLDPKWILFLDNGAWVNDDQTRAGTGLQKFLEGTSRIKDDKWTPRYQGLTMMVEHIDVSGSEEHDPVVYKMYCLVSRENFGRDTDSKAYLLVRRRHFDKNVFTENESLTEETLSIWVTRMAQEANGDVYCGSTDYRITQSIENIQHLLEEEEEEKV